MNRTRWKLMIGGLGLSLGGIAALAGDPTSAGAVSCAPTPTHTARHQTEARPLPALKIAPQVEVAAKAPPAEVPALPSPPTIPLPVETAAAPAKLPDAPPAIPVIPTLPPADVMPIPVMPAPALPPLPTPVPPPPKPAKPIEMELKVPSFEPPALPNASEPKPGLVGEPVIGFTPPKPALPGYDFNTTVPPEPAPAPPKPAFAPLPVPAPQIVAQPELSKFKEPVPVPVEVKPTPAPKPAPVVEATPASRPAPAKVTPTQPGEKRMRAILFLSDDRPRFEVRDGDEVYLRVVSDKVDVQSPGAGGLTVSTMRAMSRVTFVTPGGEGTCDELAVLPGTGQVVVTGKVQFTYNWGRVETTVSGEKMTFRLGSGAVETTAAPTPPTTVPARFTEPK